MRVNIYAEERSPSQRVEIVRKCDANDLPFVGVRFFMAPNNRPDSTVTFWAFDTANDVVELRQMFVKASKLLDDLL